MNVLDTLKQRGFVKQIVFEDELYEALKKPMAFYCGYDPTADSLHVGHFLTLMAAAHMQRAGHKPYILLGGATGKVGDPSGRTDMRKMLTDDERKHHVECFRAQMSRFVSFKGKNSAVFVNNADWIEPLNYLEFISNIGVHFSVNRMIKAECFKQRMEKGLSFLEFNYMLMQAYDFLHLFKTYGIRLQIGGDDQWSNILEGADLIRRKEREAAFAMTFTLLMNSAGEKMGKTAKGAVWLDAKKTSPYEFYQYWRNVEDADVEKILKLLTFMPLEEIKKVMAGNINAAKARLALEVTGIVHGAVEAEAAQLASLAAFGGGAVENMPTVSLPAGISKVVDIIVFCGFAKSKGEARRLIEGGGIKLDESKITDTEAEVLPAQLQSGIILHKGKKQRIKVIM